MIALIALNVAVRSWHRNDLKMSVSFASSSAKKIAPKANKQEKAIALLRELAEDHNMIPSNEAVELAKEEDISKRTLEIVTYKLLLIVS